MPTDGPAARPGQGGLTTALYVLYVIEQMMNVVTATPPFPAGREASMMTGIGSVGKAMARPWSCRGRGRRRPGRPGPLLPAYDGLPAGDPHRPRPAGMPAVSKEAAFATLFL